MSPKLRHILHADIHNKQRDLSLSAHSGGNLAQWGSPKTVSAIDVCIDDVVSILNICLFFDERLWSRFLGRECDEALFKAKKGFFREKGAGNSVNEVFGKDFYRKGKSVKRSRPFSEPPDSED